MTVYSVGTPVNTHATAGSVTGTWGAQQFRVAGVLVAVVTCGALTSVTATGTASGWVNQFEQPNSGTANVRVAIWTKVAAGSDAAPTFTTTVTGTGAMDCMLFELSGANTTTPVDVSATYASGGAATTVTGTATTGALASGGEFLISCFAQNAAAGNLTFTDTGTYGFFSKILNGNGASSVLQTYIGVSNPDNAGITVNDAGTFSANTTAFGAGLVVAFASAPPTPGVNVAFANNAAATVTVGGTGTPAAGTVEAWTVSVTSAFPVASATAGPPSQFTVCDPQLPAEKFLVTTAPGGTGGSQSWSVTRGAEGSPVVAHGAGFSIVDVTTGGFLTGVAKKLSATAYVDCDYTGTVDASAAFNAALASLPLVNGRSVGKIVFGPGQVKMAVTPNNPGSCVWIEGAGKWATIIWSYVPSGDCFRVFDPTVFSPAAPPDNTVNGGGIKGMTILGDNAGAGSTGIHLGDLTHYELDVTVIDFTGAGSKGIWFDNETASTELVRGYVSCTACTQCVVFDNPATATASSTGSFARTDMTINVEQGLDGTGQVYGDGVVVQNGALLIDSAIRIVGNYAMSAAATSAALLRIIGSAPAGHATSYQSAIKWSRLDIGVELNARGANAFAPMTIFSDGTGNILGSYGVMDFGAGGGPAWTVSNIGAQLSRSLFLVNGDNNLGYMQVIDTEQIAMPTGGYTLANNASAQPLFNVTAAGAVAVIGAMSYFFECEFDITGLSSSAHTVSFGFAGSSTVASCKYVAMTGTGAAATPVGWLNSVIATSAASVITASVTTTTLQAWITGIIRITNGGTLVPQITQTTNTAAGTVQANSWFRLTPVGLGGPTYVGNWT